MKRLIALSLMAFGLNSLAGVNLKNGNFYISYTDIIVPGAGETLEITRTYNSKSAESNGWFGFGWGSGYETNLTVGADGTVTINENGSGAKTRFTPKVPVDPKVAAKRVVDAMRKKAKLTEKTAKELVEKLAKDQEERLIRAKKLGVSAPIASGTKLFSNLRGIQTLERMKKGWKRLYNDGKAEFFNEAGKLSKIVFKNKYNINFAYENGLLKSIKDSNAKQLFFDWYSDNRIKAVWSAGDKKATYKFKGADLSESVDVGGNVYKYTWDSNHNLVKVSYSDGTFLAVTYEPKTQFVGSIKNRNGDLTQYKYGADSKSPDYHYWTEVTKKNLLGKTVTNKYEYWIKTRGDGSNYTQRILTSINGVSTDTVYNECCGLPVKIARGKHVTNFEYNDKGLLLKKTSTKGDNVALEYDKKFNKISKVTNSDGWTNFSYDKNGNLTQALNSKGKAVLLIYDRKARISKMVDKNTKNNDQRTLAFKYNALGKPVEIKIEKLGKINIAYDNYGEIKKVESKAGHKMAVQVTQAFQNLLAIVKPAGVSLSL